MLRQLGRNIKEAFLGIFRHFAMASSSSIAITITLVIVSALTLIIGNVDQISSSLESGIQIFAKIDSSVSDDDVPALKQKIEKIVGVIEIEYSSADNELTRFIDAYGEDGQIFEIYREDNPLSRVFLISTDKQISNMAIIADQIQNITGISSVDYGGTTTEDFLRILNGTREIGYIIVIAMSILAVFLIYNTIKLTIDARKEEIAIMRFVGASNSYVRNPLVIEGIIIGVLGSIIPILATIFGYRYLYTSFSGKLVTGMLQLRDPNPFAYIVSGFLLILGVSVGLVGSYLAATKFLRWKR